MVEALLARGGRVTVLDRDADAGAELIAQHGARVLFVHADLRSSGDLAQAFAEHWRAHGRLDVALLNAGMGEVAELGAEGADITRDGGRAWIDVLRLNLESVVLGTHLAIQLMRRTPDPSPKLLAW